jgi:uncharacterized protein YndB with AHSA1/START domain
MTGPTSSSSLRIDKPVRLDAPLDRVWRALTHHTEFGTWFRVQLDQPFAPGAMSTGRMTYPGHEGAPWLARVERMEPQRLFAFRWFHAPEGRAPTVDDPTTLVEFKLEPAGADTTLLTISESGFEALGDARAGEVMRGNTEGWNIQASHIAAHVAPDVTGS